MAIWVPPFVAIISDGAILIPGPILGVVFFSPIFGLGVAKFVANYKSRTKTEPKRDVLRSLPSQSKEKTF